MSLMTMLDTAQDTPLTGAASLLQLTCRQVRWVGPDVKTFVFDAPPDLDYEPGQFMTWTFDIAGQQHERCYTLTSTPTRPGWLSITVKRVPGGVVSNWLHDHLTPGTRLQAIGPGGSFCISEYPAEKYLFLGGGSGITPFMSILRDLHDRAEDADIVFIQNARTPEDLLFTEELTCIARDLPNVRVVHVCDRDLPSRPWHGHRGYLSSDTISSLVPDVADREVFCCGPEPYMARVREFVAGLGVDVRAYHEESFDFTASPVAEPAGGSSADVGGADPVAAAHTVEFRRSGRKLTCDAGTTLLQVAYDAGLNLASSCMQGICGTCKSGLVSGEVDMQPAGGIRPREIAQGKILLCCSTAKTDLVIDA
jgi:ferredoxin-NADP reductase